MIQYFESQKQVSILENTMPQKINKKRKYYKNDIGIMNNLNAKKIFLLSLLILCICGCTTKKKYYHSPTLRGYIIDSKTGNPISGVDLTLKSFRVHPLPNSQPNDYENALSDDQGYYILPSTFSFYSGNSEKMVNWFLMYRFAVFLEKEGYKTDSIDLDSLWINRSDTIENVDTIYLHPEI